MLFLHPFKFFDPISIFAASRSVASLLITGGRFPQILDFFQGSKIVVLSGCPGEASIIKIIFKM